MVFPLLVIVFPLEIQACKRPKSLLNSPKLLLHQLVGKQLNIPAKPQFSLPDGTSFPILNSRLYHDIEAIDPDYYKDLKWMLKNDVSCIPEMTFSMDLDEEKHFLYEKTEVTDYGLKLGGRNIRVTEEIKHEYIDLVDEHILTNAICPQINSFLEGFNELVPRELILIFNDEELELLISGLSEIDLDDLKASPEYTAYTAAYSVVQWF
ncbi:hypothetical protein VitviT2T_004125 [Vitis vinifera]|uniref:HECT-type E3 ubiquitin transferase n=1 Tax=Vitis vinifera TaxID=29760 RepID=A0ABY9BNJ3_VITVI|nr:hypothetical protein VitviT2T_004125 [Vitis vinifera]